MQQEGSTRTSQASVSAAIAAANSGLRDVPARNLTRPESGRSLAEMAAHDLDATLQLLTDRAQYITGSSGAAIALRRSGTNDMLCRASSGSNAPELGTLLSTEFGLSGESVRTRRALRCDDAERDARVNQDVCREVGIASVVVMPVVQDDEVLGVFELFSGRAHAFGERDMSALQRLSEMVETAVRLARAAEGIPERWLAQQKTLEQKLGEQKQGQDKTSQDKIREERIGQEKIAGPSVAYRPERSAELSAVHVKEAVAAQEMVIDDPLGEAASEDAPSSPKTPAIQATTSGAENRSRQNDIAVFGSPEQTEGVAAAGSLPETLPGRTEPAAVAAPSTPDAHSTVQAVASPSPANSAPPSAGLKKPLLWSAVASADAERPQPTESSKQHVPPAFRNLRKCEACGFPVSPERALCVECEEKKWRGQLKPARRTTAVVTGSGSAAAAAPALDLPQPETAPDLPARSAAATSAPESSMAGEPKKEQKDEAEVAAQSIRNGGQAVPSPSQGTAAMQAVSTASLAEPALVFGSALEPSQSWVARNKYVLGAMLVVAGTIAAILLLR